jgi:hypothetical protein
MQKSKNTLKIFERRSISIKLGTNLNCSSKGPLGPLQKGDNYKNAKMGSRGHLKPLSQNRSYVHESFLT